MVVTGLTAPNPSAPTGVTALTAPNPFPPLLPLLALWSLQALQPLNPHPTIPFVNPLIRKSVNPLTIGAICAIGATTIIPSIAYRPYRRYGRYIPYSP